MGATTFAGAVGAGYAVHRADGRAMERMHLPAGRLDTRPVRAFPVGRFMLYLGVAAVLMHVAMGSALAGIVSLT